jgi:hypothetical protein
MHNNTKVRIMKKLVPALVFHCQSFVIYRNPLIVKPGTGRPASYTEAARFLFIVLTLISVLKNPAVLCRGSGEGYVGVGAGGQRVLRPFYPFIGCGRFRHATLYRKSD